MVTCNIFLVVFQKSENLKNAVTERWFADSSLLFIKMIVIAIKDASHVVMCCI